MTNTQNLTKLFTHLDDQESALIIGGDGGKRWGREMQKNRKRIVYKEYYI
ncbi:hypothetical protein AB3329_04665 [Streptococcus sp. H31]